MKRIFLCLFTFAMLVGITATADAAPRAMRYADALRAAGGTVTVPPEWDGVWASEDSTYDCEGQFQGVDSYLDTLCAGQVFAYSDDQVGGPITITCSGTADATTASVSCTGSSEVVTDCTLLYTNDFEATRTGETFVAVSTTSITYSGSAFGCDLFPASCTRIVTYATRISPAPPAYCATPARQSTWGQLKVRYH